MNRPAPHLSKTALDQLATYRWPGSVRELQNTVERAIILWREGPLTFDLPASRATNNSGTQSESLVKPSLLTRDELKQQQREAIIAPLKQTHGKVSGRGGGRSTRHEALDFGVAHLVPGHQSRDAHLTILYFPGRSEKPSLLPLLDRCERG
jgi:transcriptional regulator with GAF, ATPase, and Fis domain